MRTRALLFGLCWIALQTPVVNGQTWGVRPDGSRLPELAPPGTRAVVLFFVATDCPVSNRLFPEMRRLRETFASRGVRTWFVYPNATEIPSAITAHQQAFDAGGQPLQDPSAALVHLAHAVATPEMAILLPSPQGWRTVYTGRIDDRYVRLGLERPSPTAHDGEDALVAALAGKPPRPPAGPPVGCAIIPSGALR